MGVYTKYRKKERERTLRISYYNWTHQHRDCDSPSRRFCRIVA